MYYPMTLFGIEGVAFLTLPFTNLRRELRLRLSVIISSHGQNMQGSLQLVRHVISLKSLSKLDYFRLGPLTSAQPSFTCMFLSFGGRNIACQYHILNLREISGQDKLATVIQLKIIADYSLL